MYDVHEFLRFICTFRRQPTHVDVWYCFFPLTWQQIV